MKGIIFNLLEDVVTRGHGEQTWDLLLQDAGLDGAYTSLGSYADTDLVALVGAASARLQLDEDAIVRWFGQEAMPMLARDYPGFFTPHTTLRPFLLALNDVIHPEVRKLYPGADVPVFDFDAIDEDTLAIGYDSPRRLCSLAEGFIDAAAGVYGEQVRIEQTACMKRGDDKCRIVVTAIR